MILKRPRVIIICKTPPPTTIARDLANKPLLSNMSKQARHQPGFYASIFDDISDRGLSHKYRPSKSLAKAKARSYGYGYEVERIVSKRNQGVTSISITTQVIIEILAHSLAENGVIFLFIQKQNQCTRSDWSISYGLLCR